MLERARIDVAYSDRIYGVSTFKREQPLPVDDEIELALRKDVEELLALHPGLENRNFDTYREWDALTYLLSENRRQGGRIKVQDLGAAAILGAQEFPHSGGQGIPTRFSSTEDLRRILDHLAIISRDDFLEHYDLAKMEEAAVYKPGSYDGYDADLWERFELVFKVSYLIP